MSNTEIVNETADIDDIELHEVYVYIADDNMSASVRLGKCDEGYTYDEVMNKLSLNGIKTGIDEEKIRWMISQKIYDQPVEVAFGKPVEAGKDGYYEFFFDTDAINNNRPTVREDGSIDYFNQKRFEKVNEGDLLARYQGSLALRYVESCLFLSRVNQSQDCMVRALRHLMMVKKLMLQYLERLNTVTMI